MLAPDARYLITPVSDFLASRDASGKRGLQPFLGEGLDRIIDLFKRDQLSDRPQLSVDAVIFDTGVTIGPDSAGCGTGNDCSTSVTQKAGSTDPNLSTWRARSRLFLLHPKW